MKIIKFLFITHPILLMVLPYALTIGWFTDKPAFLKALLSKHLTNINER